MKYNLKLTIKAIIRTEQMLGKPFNDLDYSNKDDFFALLYNSVLCNNEERMTIEEFKGLMSSDKLMKEAVRKFEQESKIATQYTVSDSKGSGEKGESSYMSDLIGTLIMSGIDPNYLMNEAEFQDISFLIKAYDRKKREDMERERMWTFYNMLPHVDGKKIKRPADIMVFPWEEEEYKKNAIKEIERNEALFNEFMQGKFNHYIN